MNYAKIKNYDVANGEGVRVSLFVSGCNHNCYNCFNKENQRFDYGEKWTNQETKLLQDLLNKPIIKGLSLLGGEPMEFPLELEKIISELNFQKHQDIWLWSGYTFEQIIEDRDKIKLLEKVDVLVDGLYIERLKNLSLRFRGSSNQRIIDVKHSLDKKKVVLKQL